MRNLLIKITLAIFTLSASITSFAVTERTVYLHFVNDTDNDINYSLVYNSGDSRHYLGNPLSAYLGQYTVDLVNNQPLIKAHTEAQTTIPYHYVTGFLSDIDHLAFSAMTPDGRKYGLTTKSISNPHYCSFTSDDENQTALAEYKLIDGQLKLFIIPPQSSSCEFNVTDGFDINHHYVEPIYYQSSLTTNNQNVDTNKVVAQSIQNGENGKMNYQTDLKNHPDLDKQLNADYLKYVGYTRTKP